LSRIHVYRRVTVQMPANNPACDVVLSYSDGQPALIERRIGRGRVMLMTTTANTDWNDMIPTADGAILCHTMMGFLIQGTGAPRNLKPGDAISIDLKQTEIATTRQAPPVARLVSEEFSQADTFEVPLTLRMGKGHGEAAPAPAGGATPISVTPPDVKPETDTGEVPTLVSTPLDRVGAYQVKVKGQEVEQAVKEREVYVSLNPVTDESDLRGIANNDLQEMWRQALYGSRELPESTEERKKRCELDVRNADEAPTAKGDLLQAAGSLELRWLFLLIMLPALLLESFLAMYFGDYEGRFNQIMSHMWANVTAFFK
ncbi:MAG TPA: hypothetical protein VL860_06340, partial [Planctomycetota bacterium]|nr:hypothetical protein [Planctomycetota bacterium]